MKKINIEIQKDIELNMLKYVAQICDENKLRYFLGGGTLLGAIRHKGFIPWDDDVDIMMPREDYNKLAMILKENNNKKYKYLDYKNCNTYYYPFAKLIDKRTKIIENENKEIEELGIYIDIFPIDEISDKEEENIKLFKKYKIYDFMLSSYRLKKFKNKRIIKYLIKIYMNLFNNDKKILQKIEKLGQKYTNTNTVACISGRYFQKEIMNKDYIKTYIWQEFEGYKFKVPVGYHEYLEKHYGNYMKLPPKEKQISNHDTEVYWR